VITLAVLSLGVPDIELAGMHAARQSTISLSFAMRALIVETIL
jgi:hypothetical protein